MGSNFKLAIAGLGLAIGMSVFAGNAAMAEQLPIYLACTPTDAAVSSCEFRGGHFDTRRCRCVGATPQSSNPPCLLVCFNGHLDAKRCKCVGDGI